MILLISASDEHNQRIYARQFVKDGMWIRGFKILKAGVSWLMAWVSKYLSVNIWDSISITGK